MNIEIVKSWREALVSGRYNYGRGKLRFKNQFSEVCHCGLGVLAEEYGLTIDENGMSIMLEGENRNYEPFYTLLGLDIDHESYNLVNLSWTISDKGRTNYDKLVELLDIVIAKGKLPPFEW